ncbi:MAG: transcription termination/antitermination protein NusG [Terriglobales bacterium]
MSNSSASYQQTFEIVPKIWSEKNWYAVYTSVNQEKLVAERLNQRGIEHYLPLYETVRRRSDRRVQLSLPLFPGYLFVRIPLLERLKVLEVPRVVRLVGFDATPLAVPQGEIELLQKGLSSAVATEPCEYLKKGCSVRVLSGPFAGAEGILLKRKQGFRVVISIATIMRSFTVEVGEEDIERIASAKVKFLN